MELNINFYDIYLQSIYMKINKYNYYFLPLYNSLKYHKIS